ncbi:hypothetical protein BCR33DRAFT_737349 [Rhizoclosmatium globosum]|uniref:Uncharacterized protein n=1 Tax=Rhizoclosmatium globosum TaxID=329046 RepID=A0A1Y2CFE6_9FUNG|nr:hypothetical protein BCR33DRAFT_737349 [Rhizoclosmatium globosum]|eukprot:ORY45617.1 hypothetical protein BCR33DRAFT_737349 [Rhizoclosmatium globosum]
MDAKRQSAGGRRQSNPLISLQRKEVDSPEKGLAVPGVEPNGFRASTSNLVSSSSSNLQSNQKTDNRASLPMTEEPETTDDQPTNLPPQTPPSNATVFPSSKGGKPMGFEDDDATWERFQKNNKPIAFPATSNSVPANMVSPAQSRSNRLPSVNVSRLASLNQGQNQVASSSQNQSSTAPSKELKKSLFADTASNSSNKADVSSGNSAKSNNSPISGSMPNDSSFFSRNKKSGLAKDWLPISSIWTQKKSLAREDVQVTLFAIADILASSNIPTSFAALKRQQAANDDSFNFRQQLTTDTSTPLRLFEIADRIACGGLIDAEADFPVIGWFLKLVAACPNMCMDEVELDEPTSQTVGNKSTEEPGLNRIVGSGANEASKLKIEADDILAVTFAKVEVDAAKASAVHEGSNTLKGDVTISIIEDAIEQALAGAGSSVAASSPPPTEVGSFAVRSTISKIIIKISSETNISAAGFNGQYRLHIKDEYDGLYVIPASPTMTINEIKQEALRRYGIVDFINRHDIFGVDSYNSSVVSFSLN